MSLSGTPDNKRDSIEAAFDAFCEAWFSGENPDGDAFCGKRPELCPELRERIDHFLLTAEAFSEDSITGSPEKTGSPADLEKLSGMVLGEYRIIREIGRGGMATVYEAEQVSLKRPVALKVLSPHLRLSEQAVRKFRREAEAGGRQTHPCIVSTFAIGESGGYHFIAQEYVKGGFTLADSLERYTGTGDLPRGYCREAARQIARVAEAVAHSHASGVIHRDLKPSNILLTEDNLPKVTDFGLARVEDALALSRTGDFSGTPYYMSPEQVSTRRSAIDHRTDVFSLAVTLYKMLTLEHPFEGISSQEVLKRILTHEPRDPRRINERIPFDLAVICLRAMEKEPERRYQSMSDFHDDLNRFLDGEPIAARPAGRIGRTWKWVRRHRLASLAAGASCVAVAAVIFLVFVVLLQQQTEREMSMRRFKPILEAFDWNELTRESWETWFWCLKASPSRPEWFIVQAVFEIPRNELYKARESLETCIEKCKACGEDDLLKDAQYILGIVQLRLVERARKAAENPEGLNAIALSNIKKSCTDFDHTSSRAFVWRDGEIIAGLEAGEGLPKDRTSILLNPDHYMIQLYLGVRTGSRLYLGGQKRIFDRTIAHLKRVLDEKPRDMSALSFLGRTYFFVARSFNTLDVLETAKDRLRYALEPYESKPARSVETPVGPIGEPYHMIDTTLGQIAFLEGDDEKARFHFEKAISLCRSCVHIHNAWRGLAKVSARQGDIETARKIFLKTEEMNPADLHTNVALAEFHLALGEYDKALSYGIRAKKKGGILKNEDNRRDSFYAPAYLVCARIDLLEGRRIEALKNLQSLLRVASFSPHDLSLTCYLLATIRDGETGGRESESEIALLAKSISNRLINPSLAGETASPLSLGAVGVGHFLNEEYGKAIELLLRARKERADRWSATIRRAHWSDEARDLYVLSMAFHALSNSKSAERCFADADQMISGNALPYEYGDILLGIRDRAAELLERPPR